MQRYDLLAHVLPCIVLSCWRPSYTHALHPSRPPPNTHSSSFALPPSITKVAVELDPRNTLARYEASEVLLTLERPADARDELLKLRVRAVALCRVTPLLQPNCAL